MCERVGEVKGSTETRPVNVWGGSLRVGPKFPPPPKPPRRPLLPPPQVGSLFCSAGCISLLLVVCACSLYRRRYFFLCLPLSKRPHSQYNKIDPISYWIFGVDSLSIEVGRSRRSTFVWHSTELEPARCAVCALATADPVECASALFVDVPQSIDCADQKEYAAKTLLHPRLRVAC